MDFLGSSTNNSSSLSSVKTPNFEADINSAINDPGSSTSSSFLSIPTTGFSLLNVPWYVWLIFVLVLAFLGFNIFVYLAKGTDDISNFFGPIIAKITSFFGMAAIDTTKQTAVIAATGAGAIANSAIANSAIANGANMETSQQGQNVKSTIPQKDATQTSSLYSALNSTQPEAQELNPSNQDPQNMAYSADDSSSTIQQTKTANKAGWCYIGEDRGFRSCIKVNEGDTCMSGSIFPSQEICVNPSLRV